MDEKKVDKKEYKDYYKSKVRVTVLVLKEGKHHYDNRGNKVKEGADIKVKFNNFRYDPKNDEEAKLLDALSKKGIITKISSIDQKKEAEKVEARQKAEEEIDKKYGSKVE